MGLDQQARFWNDQHWLTPHGLTYSPEAGDPGGGGEFAEQAAKWEPTQWLTPSIEDHKTDGDKSQARRDSGKMLLSDHRLRNQAGGWEPKWPTPMAVGDAPSCHNQISGQWRREMDAALTHFQSSRPAHPLPIGIQFSITITCFAPLFLFLSNALPSPYNKLESMFKRKLSADFVTWLMGLPRGWCNVDISLPRSEMAWFRHAQQRLLQSLLGDSD
jgi:hypothetical protein